MFNETCNEIILGRSWSEFKILHYGLYEGRLQSSWTGGDCYAKL